MTLWKSSMIETLPEFLTWLVRKGELHKEKIPQTHCKIWMLITDAFVLLHLLSVGPGNQ